MKLKQNILLLVAALCMGSMAMVSCSSNDDFTETIFDTHDYPLDRAAITFPLDTFLKVNFQEPYNLRYLYRMQDIGSDLQKNLVPADYDKAVDLAVLSKYLWFDVYASLAGEKEVFLKKYSPRIIHLIGSPSYNPTTGSETLGFAEGGLKITLQKVNSFNVNDIDNANEYFFVTMHHEFSHILDQTYSRPTAFNVISNGSYDATDWTSKKDSVALSQGFVSPYASSQAREDWAEVMSRYITRDSLTWEANLNTASYDWEEIDALPETLMGKFDDLESYYYSLIKPGCNMDSVGYGYTTDSYEFHIYRKKIVRDEYGYASGGKIIYTDNEDGVDGRAVILEKLQYVREWLKTYYDIDIDELRREVQRRQYVCDENGNLVLSNGRTINRLTQPYETGSSESLIEHLRQQVNQYKALMTNE